MSPAKGAPSPRKGKTYPPEVLTSEEVRALLAQCSRRYPTGIRNRALITLLYRSGLRISEALGLRPADVNFDEHSLRLLDTKSGDAQTRGFHPSADDALMRWADKRRELTIGNHGRKLFCTLDGGPLSDRYVRDMLKRLAAKAGIEKRVHPHTFRHTFAAQLEARGLTISEISLLLGHGGAATTEKYLRGLTNHQAVEALSSLSLPDIADRDDGEPEPQPVPGEAPSPDLLVIQEMLNDPEARKALAGIVRTVQARKRFRVKDQ